MSDLEIARDDIALSAIAGGNPPDSDDPTLLLLASYRADLDDASAEPVAVPALPVVPAVVPLRPRRRRVALVGLSAAAGLVVGGITAGAVAVSDRPGESLYAVHAAVFGEAKDTADDATLLLDQAAGRLARGDRAGARRLLAQAGPLVAAAPEGDRARLRTRLDDLMALAAEPARPSPRPTARPSASETPEPSESESEDNSGSGSSGSGSGSGSEPSESEDNSGSGSSNSGSGSDDLKTLDPDKTDNSGSGSGDD